MTQESSCAGFTKLASTAIGLSIVMRQWAAVKKGGGQMPQSVPRQNIRSKCIAVENKTIGACGGEVFVHCAYGNWA